MQRYQVTVEYWMPRFKTLSVLADSESKAGAKAMGLVMANVPNSRFHAVLVEDEPINGKYTRERKD